MKCELIYTERGLKKERKTTEFLSGKYKKNCNFIQKTMECEFFGMAIDLYTRSL